MHVFVDTRLIPLAYILMADKTTELYSDVFIELKTQCAHIGHQLQPAEIITDIETGVIAAVGQAFPQTLRMPFQVFSG